MIPALIIFHYSSDTFRFTGWRQGAGKTFKLSAIFFPEKEVLEYVDYFFCTAILTSMP